MDFGASRDYSKQFVDNYLDVIHSAVVRDREGVVKASKALGYLTGYESKVQRSCEDNCYVIVLDNSASFVGNTCCVNLGGFHLAR